MSKIKNNDYPSGRNVVYDKSKIKRCELIENDVHMFYQLHGSELAYAPKTNNTRKE